MKGLAKYIFILSLITAASCIEEDISISQPDSKEKSVMLKVSVPYTTPTETATRAIGAVQENNIETLHVLAFKVEEGVETFQYFAAAEKSTGNITGASEQLFNTKLIVKEYPQRFVLISNAQQKIEALIDTHPDGWVGETKEEFLEKLIFDLNGGERWNAIGNDNYTKIPMWGETETKTIAGNTATISENPIQMLRMVAKIEAQVDESVTGLTDQFKLKSVRVYNTNTSGRIVPKPGTEYITTEMIAQKASLPNTVTNGTNPIVYTDFSAPGKPDLAIKGAIYLFETAAKNNGNLLEETCVVIGGIFGTDFQESFYRIDFLTADGKKHLDILRNHKYICNIVAVNGRGYATADEAYRAKPFNINAEILIVDESDIKHVVFNKHYYIGVSQEISELPGNEQMLTGTDNVLSIITNYPNGWTAVVSNDSQGNIPVSDNWLTVDSTSGDGDAQVKKIHLLASANTGGNQRTAYIHVKAGTLAATVKVLQEKQ